MKSFFLLSALLPAACACAAPAPAKKPLPSGGVALSSVMPLAAPTTLQSLPNGVTFVTRPDKWAPRVAISLVIRAGAADETPATAGWRRLLVNAMLRAAPQGYETQGASGIEATESLSRAAQRLGGAIGATVGDDSIEIFVVGEAQSAPQLLDLALALWQKPRLSDADIENARERSQSQLDADDLDTATKTQAALRGQLFRDASGQLSAYGLPDFGTETSLANLTGQKLRELHASKLANARLTVAAAGDFDANSLRQKLAALSPLKPNESPAPNFAAPKSATPALIVRELPIPAAWVFVSYPLAGRTVSDAFDSAAKGSGDTLKRVADTVLDAPALRVLAAALGDSGKARLPSRLLKNQPMGAAPATISVAAQFLPRRYAGEMVIFAQTNPQNVERVKNALLDEVRKLRDAPLSPAELQSAKTYARGSWSIERQNLRDRAFQTALAPALGHQLDATWPARLQSVTAAQVQNAAKKYLKSYAVALVMPGE